MSNYDEITVVKYETEFVAKHKDFDVIGVGSNEFEAVLELSKALGALMFSKEAEHEALKKDVQKLMYYFEYKEKWTDKLEESLKFYYYKVLNKVGKP